MFEAFLIWLFLSLSGIFHVVGFALAILSGVALLIGSLAFAFMVEEGRHGLFERYKTFALSKVKLVIGGLFAGLIMIQLVPTDNEVKYIIGGALVWNGVQHAGKLEGIGDLPQNLLDATNHFLTESIDDETDKE